MFVSGPQSRGAEAGEATMSRLTTVDGICSCVRSSLITNTRWQYQPGRDVYGLTLSSMWEDASDSVRHLVSNPRG